ncbi:hypothetical protein BGX38DRAFT_1183258, partial [Terfezia claveryi]
QEEIKDSYTNLTKAFNEHMRAQGTELVLMRESVLSAINSINLSTAATREEGEACRKKDSEDRLTIFDAIGKLHIDIQSIKRALEASGSHPLRASQPGWWASPRKDSPPTPTPQPASGYPLPPGFHSTVSAFRQHTRCTPASIEPALPLPPLSAEAVPAAPPEATTEVIDLSNIQDTPSPTSPPLTSPEPALPLPAGTISASIKEDSSMSGNATVCNKDTKDPPLNCSKHQHDGPIPECGGAKVLLIAALPDTNKLTGERKTNQKMPAGVPLPGTNVRAKAEHEVATPSRTLPKSQRGKKRKEGTGDSKNPGKEEVKLKDSKQKAILSLLPSEIPSYEPTPVPGSISPKPGTDTPIRYGDKACDENQLDTLREETVNSETKRMKAQATYKENHQKAEARVMAESKGKERDLRNVHSSRHRLVATLNPPSAFIPLPTTVLTENMNLSLRLSATRHIKLDWYSESDDSEDNATDTLTEERELHLRKAANRVARIALIDCLDKVLKDRKRSPLYMKKVSRVKKEL